MALLRYLQSRDGLPDPRGPLSSTISAQAIAEVNREVQEPPASAAKGLNVGLTSDTVPVFVLSKYASHHSVAAAARYFRRN